MMVPGGVTGLAVWLVTLAVPSLACARWLGRGLRVDERVLLGMAVGPPLLGLMALPFLAWVRMPAGSATGLAWFLALSAAAWPAARREGPPAYRPSPADAFPMARAAALAGLAMLLVAVPAAAIPFVRFWSDAWFHSGVAIEILRHGLPPQDPNFAGIPLRYPWIFHAWLACLVSVTGLSAFTIQSAINVWYAAVLTLAAGQLAWRLAGRAAVGPAMVIALIGLNPFGAWLWLARALFRHHGGLPAAWALLAGLGGAMQSLTFGFSAVQSSLLDRFWTGTALTPAIAIGLTLAWSVAVLVAGGSRRGTTRVFALVLVMAAWHPAYAALVAAALVAGLVAALPGARVRECIAGALALALAMSLAAPYVRACSVPGALTPVSPGLYRPNLFAMIVGTGVWWMLALPALIGAVRGAQGRMLLVTLLVTSAMALFIVLPERNSEKILYAVWVLLAPFSAAGAIGWEKRLRWPRWRTVALVLALALPTTFLYVAGVARESRSPGVLIRGETEANRGLPLVTSEEREAYTRLRETTPGDLVVIEAPRPTVNEPIPVLAGRRVFCGSLDVYLSNHFGAAAWDAAARASTGPPGGLLELRAEFDVRRGIQNALFGPGRIDDTQRRYLDSFGAPLELLVRRREVSDEVWTRFDDASDWSRDFHNDEIRLYRWRGAGH